jgi:hypothetical protein
MGQPLGVLKGSSNHKRYLTFDDQSAARSIHQLPLWSVKGLALAKGNGFSLLKNSLKKYMLSLPELM